MKTCVDISAFLKRITAANANVAAPLTMCHDGKAFIVKVADMSSRSLYLDDALENLAEETRRRANGMQAAREIKSQQVKAPTVQQSSPSASCPVCNAAPVATYTSMYGSYRACLSGHYWNVP